MGESGCHFNLEKYTAIKLLLHYTLVPNELTNWLIFLSFFSACHFVNVMK